MISNAQYITGDAPYSIPAVLVSLRADGEWPCQRQLSVPPSDGCLAETGGSWRKPEGEANLLANSMPLSGHAIRNAMSGGNDVAAMTAAPTTPRMQEAPFMHERVTVPSSPKTSSSNSLGGLTLSAADALIKNARAGELVLSTIASLDETIRWISASAFKVIADDPQCPHRRVTGRASNLFKPSVIPANPPRLWLPTTTS